MRRRHHAYLAAFFAAALFLAMPQAAFASNGTSRSGIDGAAEALRNELNPILLTYENLQEQRSAAASIDIAEARVQGLQDVMYDGNPVHPTITLKLDGTTLVEGTDFDVAFEGDTTNPGTVSVTITGKGLYSGQIDTGFTILPGDLAYATIDVIPDQESTGEELQPAPTVELGGKTLVEGTDYTVAYLDNIEEGTATIVITGIGNCAGEQHASFEIIEGPDEETQSTAGNLVPIAIGFAVAAGVALLAALALLVRLRRAERKTDR